jgi:hypothetical protein
MFSVNYLKWNSLLITVLFLYFAFWWFFKLETLPGLHGDEAWVGIKAHDYKLNGIDKLSGMTYYTGILQTKLAEFSFTNFGMGVRQLRLPGVVVNIIALIIIIVTLFTTKLYKQAVLFLFFLASSSLYVISPRIAWEVNSFTLFFLAVSFSSLAALNYCNPKMEFFWTGLFWLSNLLGSYNHIIYSSICVASFLGLTFWSLQRGHKVKGKIIVLFFLNFSNVVIVFLLQRYKLNFIYTHLNYLPSVLFATLVGEYLIYRRLKQCEFDFGILSPEVIHAIPAIFTLKFLYYHGLGFFDVLSNYKLILLTYSYECSILSKAIFVITALTFVLVLVQVALSDLKQSSGGSSLPLLIIISYLAIFTFYTPQPALRYYLILYAILALYLSFKLWHYKPKLIVPLVVSHGLALLSVNLALFKIFTHEPMAVRSVHFKIGNHQQETSSVFLPKRPVIDFLRTNNISKIHYLCDPYFIEQPILFYKLVLPWNEDMTKGAIIDYNYNRSNNGFLLTKSK